MFENKTARRVVIIVDKSLKDQVLEKVMEFGARGYNYVECTGKGNHAITGTGYFTTELIRIEVITTVDVAYKILDFVHAAQFQIFEQYPLAAFTDTVEVDIRDQSLN